MRCPRCDAENREQAKFCDACGAALTPRAAPTAPDATLERLLRQVPKEYAERLLATRGQPHDERRTVTILFSDIKGSTALISQLDPEDAKEIILGAFEFLIAPIYRYEGTLVQLMGDAVLAFFGAPIAHEDDPERACRAALDITAESAEYAERLKKERGIEGFNVRVGINTGLVIVGEVGSDLRVAYTAIGDAINLAARMEQNAEPGTVLITEATHKLVAPLFETQAMPPLVVKGKAEPVATYRVLAAKAVPGKVRGIAGLESPLVGREAEYAALQEAVERLQAGVGGIVTIVGEAGLGKSRLVAEVHHCHPEGTEGSRPRAEEILRFAQNDRGGSAQNDNRRGAQDDRRGAQNDRSPQWVEGRCLSYGTSIAYLLWLDVLRGLLGVTVVDAPQQVCDRLRQSVMSLCDESADSIFPYLARLLSLPLDTEIEAAVQELDGQQLKGRTFEAIEALLFHAATHHPLILVLEDLHWADATSAELLERLLSLSDRAPVLFVCLFRPLRECPCWRIKETAARDYPHRHTDLVLAPLSTAETRVLVANLLRMDELPLRLKERILAVTEGNPFHVEEVLRALIDQKAIVRDDASGQWRVTQDVADIAIPDTLQGVLQARMDRLQEDTRRVLQMAAVIGRIFLYRVLSAIAQEEQQLDQQLVTLQRQELIRERARIPELEYIFKHELTREVAYNGLLKTERRAVHRRVAEVLERLYPEHVEELVGLLAYHWERAGDALKATQYLLRAGDQARLAYAHEEALDYYSRALHMADTLPPDKANKVAFAAHRGRGQVRFQQGRFGEAIQEYRLLVEKAQQAGDTAAESEAQCSLAQVLLEGVNLELAMTHADRALALASSLADERLIAKATWIKTMITFMAARFSEGAVLVGQCIDLSRKLGDKVSEAEALWYLGAAHVFQGNYELGSGAVRDGLRMCREVRNGLYLNGCYYLLALELANVGKYGQALAALDDLIKTAEETNIPYWLPRQLNVRGYIHHELGAVAQAVDLDQQSLAAAREAGGQPEVESHALVNLATDYRLLGDYKKSHAYLDACADRLQHQDGCTTLCRTRWLWNMGQLSLVEGDYNTALKYAQETLDVAQGIGEKKYLARGQKLKGEALALAGNLDGAAEALQEALDTAKAIGQRNLTWQISYSLAQVCEQQGRTAEARALYEQALRTVEQIVSDIGDSHLTHIFTQSGGVQTLREALAKAQSGKRET